jgi:hypothetical protein
MAPAFEKSQKPKHFTAGPSSGTRREPRVGLAILRPSTTNASGTIIYIMHFALLDASQAGSEISPNILEHILRRIILLSDGGKRLTHNDPNESKEIT